MKKQRVFCPYCAKPVVKRNFEGKVRDLCMGCTTVFYENPLPVACAIVVNDKREVLLVKRRKDPYKGMWCLPIGFAESGEEIKGAALRELEEETGITGEIVRLIDVDTIENDYYGSLAIVTYEVKQTGGKLRPGDDATDARFFPITEVPPLAWSSNEKAVRLYLDLYLDTWAMLDSFRQLFPDIGSDHTGLGHKAYKGALLSNILVKMIDRDREEITRSWTEELGAGIPALAEHMTTLVPINLKVLKSVREGLEQKRDVFDTRGFTEDGKNLRCLGIALPDILNALALSRKSIWVHVIRHKILSSPLEIYSTLELNNRIIFLYDRVNYYITAGYTGTLVSQDLSSS
jgi:ADP-ribose pyrophosphatase YjhB (NUDIX family)